MSEETLQTMDSECDFNFKFATHEADVTYPIKKTSNNKKKHGDVVVGGTPTVFDTVTKSFIDFATVKELGDDVHWWK